MGRKTRRAVCVALGTAVALGLIAPSASAQGRQLRLLPLPAGATSGTATDITAAGVVYGFASGDATGVRAVSWIGGRVVPLEPAGGTSELHDVNDLGMAVGSHRDGDGPEHAVLWFAGRRIDLNPDGAESSEAVGTNNLGQVLIRSTHDDGGRRVVRTALWRAGTARTVVEDRAPTGFSRAVLGEGGHVVATFSDGTTGHTRIWRGADPVREIPHGEYATLIPVDVNRAGDVAAEAILGGMLQVPLAHLWHDGVLTPLPGLTGSPHFTGFDLSYASPTEPGGPWLNSAGDAVGYSPDAESNGHSVHWHDGEPIDLTPAADLSLNASINERGQVSTQSCVDSPTGSLCTALFVDGAAVEEITSPAGRVTPFTLHPYLPRVVGEVSAPDGTTLPFLWR